MNVVAKLCLAKFNFEKDFKILFLKRILFKTFAIFPMYSLSKLTHISLRIS